MLTEERHNAILRLLQEKGAVTVTELTVLLGSSESTIRRDLNSLDELGKLNKVHGGATVLEPIIETREDDVSTKALKNVEEKIMIARYAASLIKDEDFIFIDAGTTTERMIDFLKDTKAIFVTNGIVHAKKLIQKGLKAYIIGGELKVTTEAIVGAEGLSNLKKYNFSKSFLGTNGIHINCGYSTMDVDEAIVKKEVINRSFMKFVLADHTKFGKTMPVTFAEIRQACIITDKVENKKYLDSTVIKELEHYNMS